MYHVLEFNSSQWLKPFIKFNIQKRKEAGKNGDKDEKLLYTLMNNTIYRETTEKLRNKINARLINNNKDYLKRTSKASYMQQRIFDNNLVAIRKSKVALKLDKPVYIGMFILELSKVLMCKFH